MKHPVHNTQSWLREIHRLKGKKPFSMRKLPKELQIGGPSIKQLERKGYVKAVDWIKEDNLTWVTLWQVV